MEVRQIICDICGGPVGANTKFMTRWHMNNVTDIGSIGRKMDDGIVELDVCHKCAEKIYETIEGIYINR